jgi:hypothetical protein
VGSNPQISVSRRPQQRIQATHVRTPGVGVNRRFVRTDRQSNNLLKDAEDDEIVVVARRSFLLRSDAARWILLGSFLDSRGTRAGSATRTIARGFDLEQKQDSS